MILVCEEYAELMELLSQASAFNCIISRLHCNILKSFRLFGPHIEFNFSTHRRLISYRNHTFFSDAMFNLACTIKIISCLNRLELLPPHDDNVKYINFYVGHIALTLVDFGY